MTSGRVGLALIALAGGCNGHFVFDEHSDLLDASPGDGPLPSFDGPSVPAEPTLCSVENPDCLCSGTLCSCARQLWCRFTGSVCPPGGPCTFYCHNSSRCDGECRDGCRLECEHGSTCTLTMGENAVAEAESSLLVLTVGPMSHVHCENSATCHVTCTGSCALDCQQGATCDLRCAGEAAARGANQGGGCPR